MEKQQLCANCQLIDVLAANEWTDGTFLAGSRYLAVDTAGSDIDVLFAPFHASEALVAYVAEHAPPPSRDATGNRPYASSYFECTCEDVPMCDRAQVELKIYDDPVLYQLACFQYMRARALLDAGARLNARHWFSRAKRFDKFAAYRALGINVSQQTSHPPRDAEHVVALLRCVAAAMDDAKG